MRMSAVAARDLVLGYGSTVALARSSFTLPRGCVTAVIGPNGSGKSTVLNAIAGLLEPRAGTIEVPARRAGGAHRVAYVLQSTKVNEGLPITVREVVSMGRYAGAGGYRRLDQDDRRAVASAMERTGTAGLAARHLNHLSGGQRQRVFVAQGLAQDHEMLLLDEPLTGIDLPTAQAIDAVIHDERSRGCTVIMTTHDLSEARVADHVLLLAGRAVASGPPDEVLTAEHLSAAYGASLLHVDGEGIFVDDPAHQPVPGRHTHRQRTIHTEPSPTDLHGD
jgi:manganese transport system ATP-binding protein